MGNETWHISKSVPATVIFALIVQAGAIVWTVSTMSADIISTDNQLQYESDERKTTEASMEDRIRALEKDDKDQAVLLARMDENIKTIIKRLDVYAERD